MDWALCTLLLLSLGTLPLHSDGKTYGHEALRETSMFDKIRNDPTKIEHLDVRETGKGPAVVRGTLHLTDNLVILDDMDLELFSHLEDSHFIVQPSAEHTDHGVRKLLNKDAMVIGSTAGAWHGTFHTLQTTEDHPEFALCKTVAAVEELPDGSRKLHLKDADPSAMIKGGDMKANLKYTGSGADKGPLRRLDDEYCEEWCAAGWAWGGTETDDDGGQTIWCASWWGGKGCYEYTWSLEVINFNFDTETQSAEQVYDLSNYTTADSGEVSGIVCQECYAYLGAEFVLEIQWWSYSIRHFKVYMGGGTAFRVDLDVEEPRLGSGNSTAEILLKLFDDWEDDGDAFWDFDFGPFTFGFYQALYAEVQGKMGAEVTGTLNLDTGFKAYAYAQVTAEAEDSDSAMVWEAEFETDWDSWYNFSNNLETTHDNQTYSVDITLIPTVYISLYCCNVVGSFSVDLMEVVYEAFMKPSIGFTKVHSGREMELSLDGDSYERGQYLTFTITYEGFEGINEELYVDLMNDGWEDGVSLEIMAEDRTWDNKGSVTFEWLVPWHDYLDLDTDSEYNDDFYLQVYTSFNIYDKSQSDKFEIVQDDSNCNGLLTAPGDGDTIVAETELVVEWDPEPFHFFESESGSDLGEDKLETHVKFWVVGIQDSIAVGKWQLYSENGTSFGNDGYALATLPINITEYEDAEDTWFYIQMKGTNNANLEAYSSGALWLDGSSGSSGAVCTDDERRNLRSAVVAPAAARQPSMEGAGGHRRLEKCQSYYWGVALSGGHGFVGIAWHGDDIDEEEEDPYTFNILELSSLSSTTCQNTAAIVDPYDSTSSDTSSDTESFEASGAPAGSAAGRRSAAAAVAALVLLSSLLAGL
mmetsp:Transcript_39759/g.62188  ORF Transcript_39759/g.62188 Transcript_39759/m.62188 type:complete len:866 (-) Transcript_39759:305-2902(-)